MRLPLTLRLAFAATAFVLSLPALADSHSPVAKAPAKRTQTVVGRTAAKRTTSAPAGQLAVVTPAPAAAPEAPATAQTVTLTGVVVLADGQPCPGASVFMAGAPRQLVITDERGGFSLPVPAGGPLAIQADYFGVGSTRMALDKPNGQPLRLMLGR